MYFGCLVTLLALGDGLQEIKGEDNKQMKYMVPDYFFSVRLGLVMVTDENIGSAPRAKGIHRLRKIVENSLKSNV